jgi:hypothetical protein
MRVMVIVKASKESEAGEMPGEQVLAEMGKFNEQFVKAGVMLAGERLHPTSRGKRVRFSGKERTVIDGPFAESKDLIAVFWLWQVKNMEEAVEWLKRTPFDGGNGGRDPAGVRGRRLRLGVHAGAARPGGALPRRGRAAKEDALVNSR